MSEISFIEYSLANAMEDLEILFKHDKLSIDLECFNELNSILSSAEDGVKTAMASFEVRHRKRSNYMPDPSQMS